MKYPKDEYNKVVWLFDQSSGHTSCSEDERMTVNDSGKQSVLRNTTWRGVILIMALADGKPKGLKSVLHECGIDTFGMVTTCVTR